MTNLDIAAKTFALPNEVSRVRNKHAKFATERSRAVENFRSCQNIEKLRHDESHPLTKVLSAQERFAWVEM